MSSATSSGQRYAGHKRGISEAIGLTHSTTQDGYASSAEASPTGIYKSVRQSLKPLPQPPDGSSPSSKSSLRYHQQHLQDIGLESTLSDDTYMLAPPSSNQKSRPKSLASPRVDSVMPSTLSSGILRHDSNHHTAPHPHSSLTKIDLQNLQKSSTSHLRTLSKLTNDCSGDFSITSPAQEVAGLHGRRRLQRSGSARPNKGATPLASSNGYAWSGVGWMDKQRQFLQAYEYLCHIGEAKEWIEDIIHKPIPPTVQLEEALRDGVTLAEVVQALFPDRALRIFRHPKLQFRHSDNIALFFRFLADLELPELFRFELIDLYEKKNIPKVIYCIHALSWLLYRKGIVSFRIGNLVGQLQFEHHELEEMQRGLDKAGVSMPSFSGVGANFGAEPEPELLPEPLESEDERIQRELNENVAGILEFQAQARAAFLRLRLGSQMQGLWDSEKALIQFQATMRGNWARQIFQYRIGMKLFAISLQSFARGFLVRSRQKQISMLWKSHENKVVSVQSLARARKARDDVKSLKLQIQMNSHGVKSLQSAIRGTLLRKALDDQAKSVTNASDKTSFLQAAIRRMLLQRRIRHDQDMLSNDETATINLQAKIKGALLRQHQAKLIQDLTASTETWIHIQALFRGKLCRSSHSICRQLLQGTYPSITILQAIARAGSIRHNILAKINTLHLQERSIKILQTAIRGSHVRQNLLREAAQLREYHPSIIHIQSVIRGQQRRTKHFKFLAILRSHQNEIIGLQALTRAMLLRIEIGLLLNNLEIEEDTIVSLQATARAKLVQKKFVEKQRFFKDNMEKVVKLQSFVRGRLQGEAYKSLTSGKNPPVGTIKGFVHLLNDSDFDFDEEIEFERLRKTVVQHVRQNEMAEQYIDQLDIKIALLVKNKITLDEVVKHQKHFGGHVGSLLTNTDISSKDPFDLKALNKNSRKKLEYYQQLFFVLQTQPQYLARLFKRIREQGTAEKDCKKIENLMMGLFGYAQKRREEYYLLKLISRSIKEDIDGCSSVQDYLRSNFFWAKLTSSYFRSPRDRKYMRDLLGPLVKENIIDDPELDLESDPIQIYRSAINNEELRTGQKSRRRLDVPREEAIRDDETRKTFIHHLQDLRDISDQLITALEDLLHRMPYGIRFISQQIFQSLCFRFPQEEQAVFLQIVGHWVWKSYLQPALTQPEKWSIVDRGLTPLQKRNLGEVAKVLGQIAVGRLFGGENVYLQPLNSYIGEAIQRTVEIWRNLISVRDAEAQFDIDEFNDLYARTKPTLYIKMADIFEVHNILCQEISFVCPNKDDMLRELVHELGSAKGNENELMGVSSAEICLTLNPKLHDAQDPNAEIKTLFMETKRCILYIIRIQSGSNLMEILVKPITMEEEEKWQLLLREEFSSPNHRQGAYSDVTTLLDITSMSYAELKRTALENILHLEQCGHLTRHNHYQDLLNEIAVDIRTKHRRRIQRQKELEGVKLTLGNLTEKSTWLEQQLKSYNDYIEQAMVTLQNKKGKKRFLLPFTKQYNHQRELERSGRVPKFGSFKYSARTLADKGVLVSYQGYSERQYEKINLTISSDEVGVFFIEGSMGSIQMPGASAQIPLDDLLQAQFNNHQFMNLFEGQMRLNVNLFLHLLFRKFYREE
ncbi:MAG: hypothetical protein M1829_002132 [Trizodia sp. TS-e1964]|nr:MAG: hypothetical protein M1829_002132 [Trizodia sp. TS-e1964]